MQQHDLALLFLEKAAEDEQAVDRLAGDIEISDAVVGFHLQQAAEKYLKAVLAERGEDIRKTHDLAYLLDVVSGAYASMPGEISALEDLTPYAADYRYTYVAPHAGPLDRPGMRALVATLRRWAEHIVQSRDMGTEAQ
jgi:HEPN domain-containing protein